MVTVLWSVCECFKLPRDSGGGQVRNCVCVCVHMCVCVVMYVCVFQCWLEMPE